VVGFHGNDNTGGPDEFSTEDTFERAMKGASEYIDVNLDIGHYVAAGGDPLDLFVSVCPASHRTVTGTTESIRHAPRQ
jgi:sugar phosphate isomerase/epimerase